uniref:Family with sequence similarity 207 member A n=1 Tax=Strix occidentalis caurina TaxID=311401 RepID=A0A8D0KTM9_STROC
MLWHGQAFSMQEGEPSPGGGREGRVPALLLPVPPLAAVDWDFSSSGVFAGLKIDPDTLVKKLDLDSRSIISSRTGLEEKTVLSKKEKMKLRKERWLQKIESVKLAKQKQKAEAKRKATPVVGDMQPLMEALPELSDLTTGGRGRKPPKRYVTFRDGLLLCLTIRSALQLLLHPPVQNENALCAAQTLVPPLQLFSKGWN